MSHPTPNTRYASNTLHDLERSRWERHYRVASKESFSTPGTSGPANRYALYTRKSTEEDERQTQSIEHQNQEGRNWAENSGKRLAVEFEESKSAKEPGRPKFSRLLAMIDAGEIDGIVCWHPDRLSRNELDAAAITYRLRKGILKDLHFIAYTFQNSPEGIMMLQIALSQSQYQVSKLASEVVWGLQKKVEKGWFPHHAPLGYKNDTHLFKGQKTISLDTERFPLVRRAWDLLLTGSYSVPQIQEIVNNKWGLRLPVTPKGRGGGPVPRTTLYRVFGNVFYAGYFFHVGKLHRGAHEPMVTLDEFDRAQAIIGRPNPLEMPEGLPAGKRRSRELPYVGLIHCARCGGLVTGETKIKPSGRSYTYYHCQGINGCNKRGISEASLAEQIDAVLAKMEIRSPFYEWALEAIEEESQNARQERAATAAERARTLTSVTSQLDALLTLRLRDLLRDDEFEAKRAELLDQREKLEAESALIASTSDPEAEAKREALDFMVNARRWHLTGDIGLKRTVAARISSNSVLNEGKLLLEPTILLQRVGEVYPHLEAEYRQIELMKSGSGSTKKKRLMALRTTWSGLWNANRTITAQSI